MLLFSDCLMAETLTRRVLEQIVTRFRGNTPSVEQVQDIVEDVLIRSPFTRTAKAYIVYRSQHARTRELASRANVGLMRKYLDRDGWAVRENSNMAYSLQGLNNFVSSEVTQQYWLEEIYTPEIRKAHSSGDFHIHDLRLLAPYCVGWDLMDLLRRGFRGVPGKVATEPAKHFGSALGQIVNFFYTLQGEAAGAQAFSHFDTLLAPFIRHDGLDYGQVKQALQSFRRTARSILSNHETGGAVETSDRSGVAAGISTHFMEDRMMVASSLAQLEAVFSQISDPRDARGVRHPFSGIVPLVFLGLLGRRSSLHQASWPGRGVRFPDERRSGRPPPDPSPRPTPPGNRRANPMAASLNPPPPRIQSVVMTLQFSWVARRPSVAVF